VLTIAASGFAQEPLTPVGLPIMTRDVDGQATVRAVRLSQPLHIDGRLDEDVHHTVPPITDFIQTLPRNNSEPTERTEAWVMFDGEYIYAAARCWDSAPPRSGLPTKCGATRIRSGRTITSGTGNWVI